MKDDLIVDISIHKEISMTILSKDEVEMCPRGIARIEWPKEIPFNPSGITMEEAVAAMDKCK